MGKMRFLGGLLAVIVVINCGASFPVKAAEPLHILALGDSIAQGYGLENPKNQSYSGVLADKVGATVRNEGINGLKSTDLLEKLQRGEYDTAIQEADVILLSIGSNDILKPCVSTIAKSFGIETEYSGIYDAMSERFLNQDVDIQDFMQELRAAKKNLRDNEEMLAACDAFKVNLQEILTSIHRINPYAVIYADNIYNPYCFADYSYGVVEIVNLCELTEPYIRRLNEAFQSESKDYILINTYLLFQKDGYTNVVPASLKEISQVNLDPHPNAKGHRAIADLIYEKLDREPPVLSIEAEQENLVILANEKIRMVRGKTLQVRAKEESYRYTMSGKETAIQQEKGVWKIEIPLEKIMEKTPERFVTYTVSTDADAVKDMGNNSAQTEELGTFRIDFSISKIWFIGFWGLGVVFLGLCFCRKNWRR